MSHVRSRSAAVALTSAALMGLSALAVPATAGAADLDCAPSEAVTYSVTGGSIQWGVKRSYRSYLKGNIAQGGWDLADGATFVGSETGEDGRFSWPISGGSVAAADSATASATGTVNLHGHHGALETTMKNPTVVIDGDEAVLKMDYRGKKLNMDPNATPEWSEGTQVPAANFSPNQAGDFQREGTVTVSAGTSTLAPEFVAAMGNYDAGKTMDPVTAVLEITASCEPAPGGGNGGGNGDGDDDDDQGTTPECIFGSLGTLFGSLSA